MKHSRRASTLLTVLLCAVGLAMVCFCMASALLSHYNLAVRYRDTAQSHWMARAALAEFVARCETLRQSSPVTSIPPPVLEAFRDNPVLLTPTEHLPAKVTLLLAGLHESRDNSLNPLPAQSSFDSGAQKSIPPFSLELVLRVEQGGRNFLYQALLQQRWPYALAAPGPIQIVGKSAQDPAYAQGSRVRGPILAMSGEANLEPYFPSSEPMYVEEEFYRQLLPFSIPKGDHSQGGAALQVGGLIQTYQVGTKNIVVSGFPCTVPAISPAAVVSTTGAMVRGGVDLYNNTGPDQARLCSEEVKVVDPPSSQLIGTIRKGYWLGGQDPLLASTRQRLDSLFAQPNTSEWEDISTKLEEKLGNTPGGINDILITSDNGLPNSIYVAGGKARCQKLFLRDHRLTLDNCSLACEGDLILRNSPDKTGQALVGSNATLVVGNSLIVDGGSIDAGGKGTVIFSRRFLIRAAGHYNGLLIGREGGGFFGNTATNGLAIRGGVLLGSNRIRFDTRGKSLKLGEDSTILPTVGECSMGVVTLASTTIDYDPQYMRGLNQFGGFQLQGLVRR